MKLEIAKKPLETEKIVGLRKGLFASIIRFEINESIKFRFLPNSFLFIIYIFYIFLEFSWFRHFWIR